MLVIDSQIHAYERNHPGRPWASPTMPGLQEVDGPMLVNAMEEVGVEGAILVSPWALYGYDADYVTSVRNDYPDLFALVLPVDPRAADVEQIVADWSRVPGAVGIRIMLRPGTSAGSGEAFQHGWPSQLPIFTDVGDSDLHRCFAAATRHSMTINLSCWGNTKLAAALAARHPDCRIVLDHVGLMQPIAPPAPPDAFDGLPGVLELARHDNIAIKLTGIATLSREAFPHDDLWDPLARIFDAFGFQRCIWGSDWTRTVDFLSYREAADLFRKSTRISHGELAALMGGTLRDFYGWEPAGQLVERQV